MTLLQLFQAYAAIVCVEPDFVDNRYFRGRIPEITAPTWTALVAEAAVALGYDWSPEMVAILAAHCATEQPEGFALQP